MNFEIGYGFQLVCKTIALVFVKTMSQQHVIIMAQNMRPNNPVQNDL